LANVDDVLTVKVIEFNRDDKRILVSHLQKSTLGDLDVFSQLKDQLKKDAK